MIRQIVSILGLLRYIVLAGVIPVTYASEDEFSLMSLEELVNVKIFAASVLTAHVHKKDNWMLSYDYMSMNMSDINDGRNKVSTSALTNPKGQYGYMIAPLAMTMDMHMFHYMRAQTDDLTWMVMAKYVENNMLHQLRNGHRFSTASSGWSDTSIKSNYIVNRQETEFGENEYGITLGLSLPTGSIDKKDLTPLSMGSDVQLPYQMQLGSGSYDITAGAMYLGLSKQWYWGVQATMLIRTGKNDHGYTLGDHYEFNAWLNRSWGDHISTFVRVDGKQQQRINGRDKSIPVTMTMMVPTANAQFSAKTTYTLSIGADLVRSRGIFNRHRFGFELGKPFYQHLTGPQLTTNWILRVGWQVVF